MLTVTIIEHGGTTRQVELHQEYASVGRVQGNDILLTRRNVSKQHARFEETNGSVVVVDLNSTNGTWVDGERVRGRRKLKANERVYIADYILCPSVTESTGQSASSFHPPPAREAINTLSPTSPRTFGGSEGESFASSLPTSHDIPAALPNAAVARSHAARAASRATEVDWHPLIDEPPTQLSAASTSASDHKWLSAPHPSEHTIPAQRQQPAQSQSAPLSESRDAASFDLSSALAHVVVSASERFNVYSTHDPSLIDTNRYQRARRAIEHAIRTEFADAVGFETETEEALVTMALHEAVGLGPLDELLNDASVDDILVRSESDIAVFRGGRWQQTAHAFSSELVLTTVAERLVTQIGQGSSRRALVHGVVPAGFRASIFRRDIAPSGPVIRLKRLANTTFAELEGNNVVHEADRSRLVDAIRAHRNIVVLGKHDRGVSTLVSACLAELALLNDPVVLVHDAADVRPPLHTTVLSAANVDDSLAELVRYTNHLPGSRIVVDGLLAVDVRDVLIEISCRDSGHIIGVYGDGTDPLGALMASIELSGVTESSAAALIESSVHLIVSVELADDSTTQVRLHTLDR